MSDMYPVFINIVLLMLAMLPACTTMQEKRQLANNLRTQIQNHDRLLSECRSQIQALTGQPGQTTSNNKMSGSGNWGWYGFDDDRKRSVSVRQLFFGNNWNNNAQLQKILQTRINEYNQCLAQQQSVKAALEDLRNKELLAQDLLTQINVGVNSLRTCVGLGGQTTVDMAALSRYINNGGFVQPQNTQPSSQNARPIYIPWLYLNLFRYNGNRQPVARPQVDWTQVVAQRQKWRALVQEAVVRCWTSIGRLPDGSLPPTPAFTPPPRPPPTPRVPQPPPPNPPPALTTTRSTTKATAKPTTKTTATTRPTSTTTGTTTTTLPTTTRMKTTTTPAPTITTAMKTTASSAPTTTTINYTSTTVVFFTTTGPGLTTTFAPLLTTSPC